MLLTEYDIECLKEAKTLIDKNNRQHHTIGDIARAVGMGATKLKAGFKLYYGSGLYAYLREQRMQQAKLQLADSGKTIKAIAKTMGFKHTSNFTTAFRKRFGVTPGKWRNR